MNKDIEREVEKLISETKEVLDKLNHQINDLEIKKDYNQFKLKILKEKLSEIQTPNHNLQFILKGEDLNLMINRNNTMKEDYTLMSLEEFININLIEDDGKYDLFKTQKYDLNRRVIQIDEDGRIIGIYDNCKEAAKETGFKYKNINAVCNNLQSRTGGYKFKYINPKFKLVDFINKKYNKK